MVININIGNIASKIYWVLITLSFSAFQYTGWHPSILPANDLKMRRTHRDCRVGLYYTFVFLIMNAYCIWRLHSVQ